VILICFHASLAPDQGMLFLPIIVLKLRMGKMIRTYLRRGGVYGNSLSGVNTQKAYARLPEH